ncbi:class II aldolase/adducin family protein [Beijerinckia sp. L45]|uniref:class II aldolase/adducin family protein n=1 Tax=Beijerinckia sp. L45 TaxID=1641855 RepID=UPI00131CA8BF|nr:class II aldolase/adducin family protein [Beijerinckia sp. L45]
MNDDRAALVDASKDLVRLGLNQGTAGNISLRHREGMLITPSGIAPETMARDMMAVMSLDAETWTGPEKPSSEWRLHRDILRHRPDVGAVVHTHSLYATVLATLHRPIPALHYMIAAFNGPEIRCTPYAPFGTQALSDLIIEHLGDRHGVLLGNHGMVATGSSLKQAMWRAAELETLAKMAYLAGCAGGAAILPDDEIDRVIERFKDYGLSAEKPRKP